MSPESESNPGIEYDVPRINLVESRKLSMVSPVSLICGVPRIGAGTGEGQMSARGRPARGGRWTRGRVMRGRFRRTPETPTWVIAVSGIHGSGRKVNDHLCDCACGKEKGRFVYDAGCLTTSSQKTRSEGFLYSSG